jgi:hypothetical protein
MSDEEREEVQEPSDRISERIMDELTDAFRHRPYLR